MREGERVQRTRRLLLVSEVDVRLCLVRGAKLVGKGCNLSRRVATATAQTVAAVRRCGDVWRHKIIAFRYAERRFALPEHRKSRLIEPAGVTELKRQPKAAAAQPWMSEKRVQSLRVRLEVGRQLKKQQAKLSGLSYGREDIEELRERLAAFAQPAMVRYPLRRFEAEPEARRSFVEP